ncbi:putative alpha-acetolactate decarboxylase [Aspergillus sclerotioniger CBS 115572]|uniref:Alpha-acetolactate decarboxylase n=1 Tax=Aspergillus sclerotioniger CBS 115572 TaxID=1450535 RepID=A0A317V4C6_9EURO|nr:putative alpha-acetolactate decarboxylase [Aspergillus sclerotioniger CBS 115572]PWY67652.1 putative alpha-acetolactate decarboxylase [Aspergillus sclerotioniger CBS 115572]
MPPNQLYQYSVIGALLHGICADGLPAHRLLDHGSYGLGTVADLDGEVIILDRKAYHFPSTPGSLIRALNPDDRIPFALMTDFHPTHTIPITTPLTVTTLLDNIAPLLGRSQNHFLSIRLQGSFPTMTTRIIPKRASSETLGDLAQRQSVATIVESTGTLFGFWSPPYTAGGIGVPGIHLHYLSEDRHSGGHVLDFRAEGGQLEAAVVRKLEIELPDTEEFGAVAMDGVEAEAVGRAEGLRE